jgi:UDP-N-acetylglucosamine 2-epimerase (hydrolysing)
LPNLNEVKRYYEIPFEKYAVAMFHPVTTEFEHREQYASNFVEALLKDNANYVVIYPNNDLGSDAIFKAYERLKGNPRFRVFPSIRFEYFLTLLKKAKFMIGNSSAGIREAPYYHIPTVNIGSRQQNRAIHDDIIHSTYAITSILDSILQARQIIVQPTGDSFGEGNSAIQFLEALKNNSLWELSNQKQFRDQE